MSLKLPPNEVRLDALLRNLQAIRSQDPELAGRLERCTAGARVVALRARSGAPAFRLGERFETSVEDPESEGRLIGEDFVARAKAVGAERIVVFGLPIHGFSALSAFAGEVLIVEPDLELVRAVLERIDLSRELARMRLCVDPDPSGLSREPALVSGAVGVLVAVPAARRRAPERFEQVELSFRPGGTQRPLDIAVIPPIYGGSLPVARSMARGLRALGHHVREFDFSSCSGFYETVSGLTSDVRLEPQQRVLRAELTRTLSASLVAGFELDPPDLVFAVAQAPVDARALAALRELEVPRAFWFCEDFRVMPAWRALAPHCDVFFHVQPDDFSEPLRAVGGRGFPLPMAFDPETHHALSDCPQDLDFSFVGAAYHNRLRFLPGLFDLGLRVFGVGWPTVPPWDTALAEPNRRQSAEACNRIFNRSVLNLNLHSSPWTDGVNPAGDYLNPRTFELAGCGAFQLVDERADLARSFSIGDEVQTFRNLEECRAKAAYFAERPDERREIVDRARARALAEHTYKHRMEVAIDVLRAGAFGLRPRKSAAPCAADTIRSATTEPGLAHVLERLAPETPLDPDALSNAIAAGEGDLSPDELLLLYMREASNEVEAVPEAHT